MSRVDEQSVACFNGDWKVLTRGDQCVIVDPQGRCRYRGTKEMALVHFASALSRCDFNSSPNLDTALKMEVERFIKGD